MWFSIQVARCINHCESFNSKFQDQWLKGEMVYCLSETQIIIEQLRRSFNTHCPHQSIGKKPPAPDTFLAKTKAEKVTLNQHFGKQAYEL